MNGTKSLLQSRGIWGAIIAIIASILTATGVVTIDAAMQGEVVDIGVQIANIGGAVVALWGRLKATKRIGAT